MSEKEDGRRMKMRELVDPNPQEIASTTDFLLASLMGGGRPTQTKFLSFAVSIPSYNYSDLGKVPEEGRPQHRE